ncbi:MAG: rod shape-determining protein RodA [Deltaproteobacteria bacterium]|nr:rod shape-determining protein RodA [Deltaproteobacteria bacterium]
MWQFDRRLFFNFSWALLCTLLAIIAMGLANLYSATAGHGYSPILIRQIYFYIAGFGLILAIISVDYRVLISLNYLFYGLVILLLCGAMLFGKSAGGAQRWVSLGLFKLQPSELAKLSLVITLASYYYRKDTGRGFTLKELLVPTLLAGIPFVLILKQPDLGTAMMLAFIAISMTLFVKLRWTTFIVITLMFMTIVPLAWKFGLKPYQRQRITTFLNPEGDPLNKGYHIIQSKIAVGSGGELGKGFLHGTQAHLDFLPEHHTDFAFSVWAEEFGFAGSLVFLTCYTFMLLLGLNIALSSRDKFGVLLAFGVVSLIFWQAFINLAMVMGLLPVVGVPLPLFSYGGSSLLTTMASIGILLSVRMRRFMVGTA